MTTESTGQMESFRISLTAMVASVRAGNHKIVWVVGESLEDAYRYGSETTVEWPVAYTTIDIWDPRPEELLVLTPAAVAALSRRPSLRRSRRSSRRPHPT